MIWCGVALQGLITQVCDIQRTAQIQPNTTALHLTPSIYSYLRESLIPEAWESTIFFSGKLWIPFYYAQD